ncbi:MAG TPA: AmmeMemoRadiSam system radical SAM enzyme [Phycisphaerales bacterium]|nr:AmmeMemoRadiSam system radical SAM enzyme [Phycisphaerales bacterium]
MPKQPYKEAVLWSPLDGRKVRCNLCHWRCTIAPDQFGRCYVRKNIDGTLYSLNYDKVCAGNVDPIEKKPLFHFQPGSQSFSVAAPGCNFRCVFCQNWQISQAPLDRIIDGAAFSPSKIVDAAVQAGCRNIAYTYTEPTVFMELCAETAVLAKEKGLANVFVSNGYMTPEAIDFARPWLDGINVDLKAFTEDFYRDLCKAHLAGVLETLEYLARKTDIWLEITTLVVPGQNDSPDELTRIAEFIAQKLSPDVPWHISRFFPQYQMSEATATQETELSKAYDIGKAAGLRYVYVGNLPGNRAESTWCSDCGALLIERLGYRIRSNRIVDHRCPHCGSKIAGYELS